MDAHKTMTGAQLDNALAGIANEIRYIDSVVAYWMARKDVLERNIRGIDEEKRVRQKLDN